MNEMTKNGTTYTARESSAYSCVGCAFQDNSSVHGCAIGGTGPGNCYSDDRMDGRSVVWIKVENAVRIADGTCTTYPFVKKSIYVIGSLRNPAIPEVAAKLRAQGYDVFDDWYSAGPEADDYWKKYEEARGHDYYQALQGYAAGHVFAFDRHHLDRADCAVLVLPAGRSGHLELGYVAGKGKPTYILHDNPDRWDVMYRFATAVVPNVDNLIKELAK